MLLMFGILPTAWLVYKRKIKFLSGVFAGAFLFLLSFGCSVYAAQMLYGCSPIDFAVTNAVDTFISAYESVPEISAEQISKMKQLMGVIKDLYFVLMPTIIVAINLMRSYVILMLAKGVFAIFRRDVSGFCRFCDFKMPKSAILAAIVAYALSLIFKKYQISYAFSNFVAIILVTTSFCGLSMIDYWLRKKVRLSILRLPIYIVGFSLLSAIMGMGASFVLFVGIADSGFDLRKGFKGIKKNDE